MDDFAKFAGDDWKKQAETISSCVKGKSESEILSEIYLKAEEAKRAGTLTNEQIDEFYRSFAPSLDKKKREKLEKLIKKLKAI